MRSSPFAAPDGTLVAAPDPARVGFLTSHDFAHRGLWGGPVPENSLAAARAAIQGGFGIECDVRLSRDGTVMVFHDADTERLTGRADAIATMAAHDIQALRLGGGEEQVPTLAQLAGLIAGRVPLLIEIKTDTLAQTAPLCLAVRRVLEGYRGPVAVMGFNPEVSRWFLNHAPKMVRGLVMTEHRGSRGRALRDAIVRRLAVRRARPDFLAYDARLLPSALPAALRAKGLPVLSWTVRSEADRATVAAHADRPIFERPRSA
ncbi:glycerophosphodiester phosphodiesterase family protein [Sphingomonas oryzagri]